ncbi:MAG: hypothetical protein ACK4SM_02940 [Aquificaceae bacterium]
MKVIDVRDERVAKRLIGKLLKKRMIVAQVQDPQELKHDVIKKVDVVVLIQHKD